MKRTRKPNNRGTILTNDPSLTAWGWAVLSWEGIVLDYGCIKTEHQTKKRKIRAGDDFAIRMKEISSELKSVIDTYSVRYILSEQPHGSQNFSAAKIICATTIMLETISVVLNIVLEWYL